MAWKIERQTSRIKLMVMTKNSRKKILLQPRLLLYTTASTKTNPTVLCTSTKKNPIPFLSKPKTIQQAIRRWLLKHRFWRRLAKADLLLRRRLGAR